MKKKVLIITYYWPPAGGPGVQRWLKFVKYLPEFNVSPTVYCPENPNYPVVDTAIESTIPDSVTLIKQPIFEPYKLASLLSKKKTNTISSGVINTKKQSLIERFLLFVRGNFFIPDARKYWVKPSVKYLEAYCKTHNIDTIITTGPPHSVHLIGLQLKEKLNLRWIADFRDPWTSIGYHSKLKLTATAKKKHKLLEKQVLQSADDIIVTSNLTKKEFSTITAQPIHTITNGFDDTNIAPVPLDKKFTISHIGSLLTGRNPKILWQVLSELIAENHQFKSNFELKLIGVVSDNVLETIYSYGLKPHVNQLGYLPHSEAQIQQNSAQVLLLIEIDSPETVAIIPGKLFEYMQSSRPILSFGPSNTAFKNIIKTSNTGVVFSYELTEKDALKKQLLQWFKAYQNNELQSHAIGLEQYHRKQLTASLASLIIT